MVTLTKHHGLGNDFLVAIDPTAELTADHARRCSMGKLDNGTVQAVTETV